MTLVEFPVIHEIKTLNVSSEAFKNNSHIPIKYTSDGENINPALSIEHIPKEAQSLVLIIEDPDAPIRTWVHWIVWNIPPMKKIRENTIPGIEGINDFRQHHYGGPCPPSGTHHYHFKIYALDTLLTLGSAATRIELEKAMGSHVLAFGELIGLYERV